MAARLVSRSNRMRGTALTITIYGIKNCDTMKKARSWLDDHGVAYDFHDYKTAGIAKDKLHEAMAHPIELGEALEPGAT